MQISNSYDLAKHYRTNPNSLDLALSNRARRDIFVHYLPTSIRIGTFLGECNTEFSITCHYPFESSAVDVFIDTIEHTCTAAYDEAFDDPIEMLMNLTDPGQIVTVEDAGQVLSEAEAYGWHIDPQLTPEDILSICNDIDKEEE